MTIYDEKAGNTNCSFPRPPGYQRDYKRDGEPRPIDAHPASASKIEAAIADFGEPVAIVPTKAVPAADKSKFLEHLLPG